MPVYERPRGNPCQDCARPIRECPWLLEEKPVPGWDAEPRRYVVGHNSMKKVWAETYSIKACPLFVKARERYSNPAALTTAQDQAFRQGYGRRRNGG